MQTKKVKEYDIEIIETYKYDLKIVASSKEEAIIKAKDYYINEVDGYVGVADAGSYNSVKFKCK